MVQQVYKTNMQVNCSGEIYLKNRLAYDGFFVDDIISIQPLQPIRCHYG